MEDIEKKVNENIQYIRDEVKDHHKKKDLDEKLNYLEDVFSAAINYIYAEDDNLKDLKKKLEGEE